MYEVSSFIIRSDVQMCPYVRTSHHVLPCESSSEYDQNLVVEPGGRCQTSQPLHGVLITPLVIFRKKYTHFQLHWFQYLHKTAVTNR